MLMIMIMLKNDNNNGNVKKNPWIPPCSFHFSPKMHRVSAFGFKASESFLPCDRDKLGILSPNKGELGTFKMHSVWLGGYMVYVVFVSVNHTVFFLKVLFLKDFWGKHLSFFFCKSCTNSLAKRCESLTIHAILRFHFGSLKHRTGAPPKLLWESRRVEWVESRWTLTFRGFVVHVSWSFRGWNLSQLYYGIISFQPWNEDPVIFTNQYNPCWANQDDSWNVSPCFTLLRSAFVTPMGTGSLSARSRPRSWVYLRFKWKIWPLFGMYFIWGNETLPSSIQGIKTRILIHQK